MNQIHLDTITRNIKRQREEARRLDKMADLCRSAGVETEALRYGIDAQRARDQAKMWELEMSREERA